MVDTSHMTTTPLRTRTGSVFVVDDDEAVRGGLAELLGAAEGLEVVGRAASTADALALVAEAAPDLVLLDARLPGTSGIGACRELRSTHPGVRCLLLTAFDDEEALIATALAGAAGHVVKQVGGTGVVDGVQRAAASPDVVSPAAVAAVRARAGLDPVLGGPGADGRGAGLRGALGRGAGDAARRDVLERVLAGGTDAEVAGQLGLDPRAVRAEVLRLFARLVARPRRPLVRV